MLTLQLFTLTLVLLLAAQGLSLYCLLRYHLDLWRAERRIQRLQEANALLLDDLRARDRTITALQERLYSVRHRNINELGHYSPWAPGASWQQRGVPGKWDWFVRGTGSQMNGN